MERLFGIFFTIVSLTSFSQKNTDAEDVCITQSEFRLYNLINKFRIEHEKEIIPISKSLTYVAKTHINDLKNNHPDTSVCNLHSWSDKGNWTACCHNKYLPKTECMLNKPRELTDYKSNGYELTYWDSEVASPDSIMDLWTSVETSKNMILGFDKWKSYKWEAIGVATSGKYALVWFGTKDDKAGTVSLCGTQQKITNKGKLEEVSQIPEKSKLFLPKDGQYHIIYGSFTEQADAEKSINQLRKSGFPEAGVIRGNNKFRISLMSFASLQEAKNKRDQMGEKYSNAWILKY